jgi:hypothetical protein
MREQYYDMVLPGAYESEKSKGLLCDTTSQLTYIMLAQS